MTSFICGVDIGGTFTDCVVIDDQGIVTIDKTPSTPDDFSRGFFNALTLAAAGRGLTLEGLLTKTTTLAHGTTVATNTLIERNGARVGLITTAGHGDSIIMMRAHGRSAGLPVAELLRYSKAKKPEPLVPRSLIREVHERVDCWGKVVVDLDEDGTRLAVIELLDAGVEAISVSFLWSFRNAAHEQRVKEIIHELAPEMFVTCSSELVPKLGEYERTVATVMNSYVGPMTSSYIESIEGNVKQAGLTGPFLLMQCNGGLTPAAEAKQAPLLLFQSGPVGGVVGSQFLGREMGYDNIIATDMGGTTFDVGIVYGGVPVSSASSVVGQYEYMVPNIDVRSVGAGGGSIAWREEISNTLRVGPQSAGAVPGPACYSRGGTLPTVTDADVVLGYIDPDFFHGGRTKLDKAAAEAAIRVVAEPLGMSVIEAAAGIAQIADACMADLIRKMTIDKGLDPRDFVVFAYGGAGPPHASGYSRELGVKEVVVPLGRIGSVWSALGVASSDIVHVFEREEISAAPFNLVSLQKSAAELHERALTQLCGEGVLESAITLQWIALLRHRLQVHVVEVPLQANGNDPVITSDSMTRLIDDFEDIYEKYYGKGTAFREAGVELVTLRCRALGRTQDPQLLHVEEKSAEPPKEAIAPSREAYWPDLAKSSLTPVYRVDALQAGNVIEGPAILETTVTTVTVRPNQSARIDGYGNIIIAVRRKGSVS